MDAIQGDRRSDRRYQIGLRLTFSARRPDGSMLRGAGWTRNLSGSGILFETDAGLNRGQVISLWIEWPRKLQDRCPLELAVKGRIVRCESNEFAVAMDHYELRTRGSRSFHESTQPVSRLVATG
jgi:hypothetical protein